MKTLSLYLLVACVVVCVVGVGTSEGQDYCRGDFNGDNRIDFADFLFFVEAFNSGSLNCEGYSFRDTTIVTQIDTLEITVRDTIIVEVEDTTRIDTLTAQRDRALEDALKWKNRYDGLKDAYDSNRAVLLSDTAAVRRSVIQVINSLPDTTQAFVRESLSISCSNTPTGGGSTGGGSTGGGSTGGGQSFCNRPWAIQMKSFGLAYGSSSRDSHFNRSHDYDSDGDVDFTDLVTFSLSLESYGSEINAAGFNFVTVVTDYHNSGFCQ